MRVAQVIDSTKAAAGAQYPGTVVNAVQTPAGAIQAGAAATIALVANSNGTAKTFTLTLTSPAQGTLSMLPGQAGALGGYLNNLPAGIPSFGRKKASSTSSSSAASALQTSGSRIYIPANTPLRFSITQSQAPAVNTSSVTPAPNPGGATAVSGAQPQPNTAVASPAPQAQAGTAPQQGGSTTVVWGNVQYALQGCHREAPHIVCQVQVTNLANADQNLATGRQTYYVDQVGNRVVLNGATVANCSLFAGCLAIHGIAMPAQFVFVDENSQATQLIRLQIQTRTGPVQFTNVAVQ